MKKHNYFPAALNVDRKKCLVIGDDRESVEKSERLEQAGAQVSVVVPSDFKLSDITDQFLVILCIKTDLELTKRVAQVCRDKRVLLCAIDQSAYCDVVNVSVFDKGRLRMTIGTGGAAPAVAKKIRLGLEHSLKEAPLEEFLDDLAHLRERLEKELPNSKDRIARLLEAADGFEFNVAVRFPSKWVEQRKEKK